MDINVRVDLLGLFNQKVSYQLESSTQGLWCHRHFLNSHNLSPVKGVCVCVCVCVCVTQEVCYMQRYIRQSMKAGIRKARFQNRAVSSIVAECGIFENLLHAQVTFS
jgi:hypothetical protein